MIKEVAALLARLLKSFGELGAEDLDLARVELATKGRHVATAVLLAFAAVLIAVGALAALTAALVLALTLVVPPWAAALIVTATYALLAFIAVVSARSAFTRALPLYPRKALHIFRENLEWAKALMTSWQI